MAGSFLNRWSRRKVGELIEPVQVQQQPADYLAAPGESTPDAVSVPTLASLEDVEKIDRLAPDFSAFMQPGVDPTVQQAALKKMFSDPHFNVMDGLDIYIDDYSKPDPIPLEMLKRMVQSDMLNIFRKDDGSPVSEESSPIASLPESSVKVTEQTLPLLDQANLRSDDFASGIDIDTLDPVPMDKKTS